MLTWKSKERDLQNAVLESHIYSLFTDNSFDISEEKICVFDFHCCLQEVMEELSRKLSGFTWGTGARVSYRSHKPRATKSVLWLSVVRLFVCCVFCYRQPSVQGLSKEKLQTNSLTFFTANKYTMICWKKRMSKWRNYIILR